MAFLKKTENPKIGLYKKNSIFAENGDTCHQEKNLEHLFIACHQKQLFPSMDATKRFAPGSLNLVFDEQKSFL